MPQGESLHPKDWKERVKSFYDDEGKSVREMLHEGPPVRALERYLWLSKMDIVEGYAGTGRSVLYLGCVPPRYRKILFRKFIRVAAIDISQTRLRSIPPGETMFLTQADAEDLPFHSESFDVILCSEFIEHFPAPDRMMREIHRVLVPSGDVLVITVNRGEVWRRVYHWLLHIGMLVTHKDPVNMRATLLRILWSMSGLKGRDEKIEMELKHNMTRHFFRSADDLRRLMSQAGFQIRCLEFRRVFPPIAYPFYAVPSLVLVLEWIEKKVRANWLGVLFARNIAATGQKIDY